MDILEDIRRDLEVDAEADDALLAKRSAHWEDSCIQSFMMLSRDAALCAFAG